MEYDKYNIVSRALNINTSVLKSYLLFHASSLRVYCEFCRIDTFVGNRQQPTNSYIKMTFLLFVAFSDTFVQC